MQAIRNKRDSIQSKLNELQGANCKSTIFLDERIKELKQEISLLDSEIAFK